MIDFDHVVKQYGKSNVRAVDDLTLHVGKGQLFGFIGAEWGRQNDHDSFADGYFAAHERQRDHRRRVDEGRSDCR